MARVYRPGPRVEYSQKVLRFDDDTLSTAPIDNTPPLDVAYGVGGVRWQQVNRAATIYRPALRAEYRQKPLRFDDDTLSTTAIASPLDVAYAPGGTWWRQVNGGSHRPYSSACYLRRPQIDASTGAGPVTGTAADTLDNFTSAATGTFVDPPYGDGGIRARQNSSVYRAPASRSYYQQRRPLASTGAGTTYILDDEFSGSSVDLTTWAVLNRPGDLANSEVDGVIPANVRESGGLALIDTKFEDVTFGPDTYHYTTGQIEQKVVSFFYGDVQVRAKIPGGTGTWPCIWMVGYKWQPTQESGTTVVPGSDWPNDGWWECDIAEFMSGHRTLVNNALHFITANRGGSGEKSLPYNATSRYMVYRLVWTPTSMTWMVDPEDGSGWQTTLTFTGVAGTDIPNTPGYVVLSCAVGGFGGVPDSATFPVTFEIDYVRIAATVDTIDNGEVRATLADATSAATGTVTASSPDGDGGIRARQGAATYIRARSRNYYQRRPQMDASTGVAVSGAVAVTLDNFTSAATGGFGPSGTSAQTLANFTSSATGAFGSNPVGTVAVTLDNFTSTASGSEVVGTSTPTLANATSAATGVHGVSGMSASTLAPFTSTASGSETLGSLARTLANFTSSAAGTFGQIYTITGHLTTSRADTRRTTERVDGSRTTEGVR